GCRGHHVLHWRAPLLPLGAQRRQSAERQDPRAHRPCAPYRRRVPYSRLMDVKSMTAAHGRSQYRPLIAAVVVPIIIALVAFVATDLIYFTTSAANPATFGQLAQFFWPASVLLWLLLTLALALDGFRRWYVALPV